MGEYMGNLTTSIHAIDFSTMRRSLRQLAAVKPSRFLEAGSPTGLTGLFTHNAPRSTLLYLYSSTLEKLKAFPESSLYRQSTEALTKHRMAIVSAVEPEGYKAWAEKARQTIKEHPEVFNTVKWDPEPPLTSEQVSVIENKIGAGLIEEVIQVAEGELKLVDVLAKSKVWEDLEEKPVEGQWEYFKRSGVLQNP